MLKILRCNRDGLVFAFSRLLLPFCFLDKDFDNLCSFLSLFLSGFRALIFVPSDSVAKSVMPKSMPTYSPVLGKGF